MTSTRFIEDPETLVSDGSAFKLGNKPLNDSSGLVTISEDGNLLRKDHMGEHPTSFSFIFAKMKISADTDSGEKVVLTSWKSPSDPSIGSFSLGMNPLNILKHSSGMAVIHIGEVVHGTVVDDKAGTVYETFTLANSSIFLYYVLTPQGTLVETYREDGKEEWEVTWRSNNSECDVYGTCGAFGICNSGNSPICSCLRGYEPKYIEEWSRGNWTSGCVRKTPLQCERTNSSGQQGKLDGFFRLTTVKVPDFADWSLALEDECREQCLKNCSCMAYSYYSGIGCMSWSGNLIDLGKFTQGGADLYIRLANSELEWNMRTPKLIKHLMATYKKRDMKAIISVTIVIGTIAIGIYTYFSWRWRRKQTVKDKSKEILLSDRGDAYQIYDRIGLETMQTRLNLRVTTSRLEKLETATNNFHEANKLGQGGFCPVYRGKLPGGQEIAVKRLSRASAQGLEEFGNEVVVISKIQHRNLVRLLGYCIEGDEKLLIYEYMPNKSLDSFLFDPLKRDFLDWRRRFNIIEGIGRGLLYLHRDSRFRIIHRDLKASNILLDEDLTAKISDFGIARIVGGNQDQANTMRVVGTYGYMSPEYAMEGRFSEKSDVFSFGVLLLEIAWTLWCEHNIEELIDEIIAEEGFQEEISRCIHVGLLAVQELAKDRPSISTVVSMLSSEIAHLPPQSNLHSWRSRLNLLNRDKTNILQTKYEEEVKTEHLIQPLDGVHFHRNKKHWSSYGDQQWHYYTLTSTHFIKNSETIVSNGSLFKLGFFSPSNSTKRYVGIWYGKTSVSSVVWVANRDKPLMILLGIMKILKMLLDSGNLVLKDDSSGRIIWESFQHPSHALLANMKLSTNMYTGERRVLTSWKKASDPSIGSFSVGVDPSSIAQTFIWNGSHPYYRTGPWNGQIFIGVANMNSFVGNGFRMDHDEEGTVSVSFTTSDDFLSLYFTLTPEGTMEEINRQKEDWEVRWESKQTECDVYGKCGVFGICNPKNSPICSCLRGYEPKSVEEWNRGNWTSGCVRKTPLQCERTNGSIEVGKMDGFFRFSSSGADLYIRVADTELDTETVVSNGSAFKLSFFSPADSTNATLASGTASLLYLLSYGWLTGTNPSMILWDCDHIEDGNPLVMNGQKVIGRITWESIQHPSHSLLPNMKLSTNTHFGINPLNIPQAFFWNGSHPYWRSGP
ncbi:G-type lectin S-receptor-like serine/threonine-protein kinase [Vitis vinifera]|uniref:non-specific serine/threonine protein kinase n=1 Tax=Vitis vinifera TaxID=29760 RepID=A0A438BS80_VITVI|nr:G-type lectin S-receptor-like serine/threonine-protein kinase [Vitis vinifera]